MSEESKLYIGAGTYIKQDILFDEIRSTGVENRIFIDYNTGVITDEHIDREKASKHLTDKIGSTCSGSGQAGVDRVLRKLKVAKDYPSLNDFTTDVSAELNDIINNGGSVLVEGSQATFLSVYHGTYPYTTSKDVCASAMLSDVGLGPTKVKEVVLVFKSFVTRVGEGYLKNELTYEESKLRGWDEYGTVTGRPRRAAEFDFELAKKACELNGATQIAITKLDILFPSIKGKKNKTDIPKEVMNFITQIESSTKVKVKYLSTGPSSDELIEL
jgi:adenylosuccinate synthase